MSFPSQSRFPAFLTAALISSLAPGPAPPARPVESSPVVIRLAPAMVEEYDARTGAVRTELYEGDTPEAEALKAPIAGSLRAKWSSAIPGEAPNPAPPPPQGERTPPAF